MRAWNRSTAPFIGPDGKLPFFFALDLSLQASHYKPQKAGEWMNRPSFHFIYQLGVISSVPALVCWDLSVFTRQDFSNVLGWHQEDFLFRLILTFVYFYEHFLCNILGFITIYHCLELFKASLQYIFQQSCNQSEQLSKLSGILEAV